MASAFVSYPAGDTPGASARAVATGPCVSPTYSNLGVSGEVVGEGVLGVRVLVEDDAAGDLVAEGLSDANERLGRVVGSLGRGADDLGTKRLEKHLLLERHLGGQRNDALVALDRAREGEADTRVAACGQCSPRSACLLVGSITTLWPGISTPVFSACSTMR